MRRLLHLPTAISSTASQKLRHKKSLKVFKSLQKDLFSILFRLSLPLGAALGAGTGLCIGASVGSTLGAVGGLVLGRGVFYRRGFQKLLIKIGSK